MKKFLIFLSILCCITGCGKYTEKDAIKDLENKVESSKGYHITGSLKIWRGESVYTYDVESSYKIGDYFKVSLVNKTNNHEQIILKNDEGIFVLTPSLNKSFKFQSEWPFNSSQVYLLQPLLTDISNDSKRTFKENKSGYVFTTKVSYSNDRSLTKQKIYFDKKMNLTKVEVMDDNNNVQIKFVVNDIDFKAKFGDEFFDTDSILDIEEESENDEDSKIEEKNESKNTNTETTAKIDDALYPMYVPSETYLSSQDKVSTDSGERLILTFAGENPFVLIQETSNSLETSKFVYGDPYMILDTVGAITDYSVSWSSNGIDYCVVSDNLDIDQLISVAESVNSVAVNK